MPPLFYDIAGFYNAAYAHAFLERQDRLIARFEWLKQHLNAVPYFTGVDFSMVDASFGPVFRYFNIFKASCGLDLLSRFPNVWAWRHALSGCTFVAEAVDSEYPDRLAAFLVNRNSHISAMFDR